MLFRHIRRLRHSADCDVSSECTNTDRAAFSSLLFPMPHPDAVPSFAISLHPAAEKHRKRLQKCVIVGRSDACGLPEGPADSSHVRLSETSSRRLCHTLSLAEGGLSGSGSGSERGQAKTSVPAGDHKKIYNNPHPNKTLSWGRRKPGGISAFSSFTSPAGLRLRGTARHTAYHSSLHRHSRWGGAAASTP